MRIRYTCGVCGHDHHVNTSLEEFVCRRVPKDDLGTMIGQMYIHYILSLKKEEAYGKIRELVEDHYVRDVEIID